MEKIMRTAVMHVHRHYPPRVGRYQTLVHWNMKAQEITIV